MTEQDLDLLAKCLTRSLSYMKLIDFKTRTSQLVPGAGASLQSLRVGPIVSAGDAADVGAPAGGGALGDGAGVPIVLAPLTITALAGLPQLQLFQLLGGDVQPLREALATARPQELFAVVGDTVTCLPG
jgi:hypothetical protein